MWDRNNICNKLRQDNDEVYHFNTCEIHSHSLTLNNGPLKLHNDKSIVSVQLLSCTFSDNVGQFLSTCS